MWFCMILITLKRVSQNLLTVLGGLRAHVYLVRHLLGDLLGIGVRFSAVVIKTLPGATNSPTEPLSASRLFARAGEGRT